MNLEITILNNNHHIENVKKLGMKLIDKLLKNNLTFTKPGSITYLLFGKKPSEQSVVIKLELVGEYLLKELIKINSNLKLLDCGNQKINNKVKDIDLLFKDEINKIIYYYELKANIELDTEKTLATILKCNEIKNSLKLTYENYTINYGILNWSVYNRKTLQSGVSSRIKVFEKNHIKVEHLEDFLKIINIEWNEHDYYSYFREIGDKIKFYKVHN